MQPVRPGAGKADEHLLAPRRRHPLALRLAQDLRAIRIGDDQTRVEREDVRRHVRTGGASAQTYRDVESACTGILQQFLSGDLLVVFGSFHTVGEVMGVLDNCAEDIREI